MEAKNLEAIKNKVTETCNKAIQKCKEWLELENDEYILADIYSKYVYPKTGRAAIYGDTEPYIFKTKKSAERAAKRIYSETNGKYDFKPFLLKEYAKCVGEKMINIIASVN